MKSTTAFTLTTIAFLALIGFCVWFTHEPQCLWALLLYPVVYFRTPSSESNKDNKNTQE